MPTRQDRSRRWWVFLPYSLQLSRRRLADGRNAGVRLDGSHCRACLQLGTIRLKCSTLSQTLAAARWYRLTYTFNLSQTECILKRRLISHRRVSLPSEGQLSDQSGENTPQLRLGRNRRFLAQAEGWRLWKSNGVSAVGRRQAGLTDS
jgi:hypothetical protein